MDVPLPNDDFGDQPAMQQQQPQPPPPQQPQQAQPLLMSETQFATLGNFYLQAQTENREQTRLLQAAQGIDRCDGAVPAYTRAWLRALDGWATEANIDNNFLIELAKSTSSGDLLDEVRRWCNEDPGRVTTWPDLRARVLEHFLSACESLKLQAMLERSKQNSGETVSAYVRRYKAEAQRAYAQERETSEEFRVVSGFLRGLADRRFAEKLFQSGDVATLSAVTARALVLEAQREKMEQVLRLDGHEVMEVDTVDENNTVATLQKQLDQLSARLSRAENSLRATPKDGGASDDKPKPKPDNKKGRAEGGKRRKSSKFPNHRWTKDGVPICNFCSAEGHLYRDCPAREEAAAATVQPSSE